jgi:hypothetical protein
MKLRVLTVVLRRFTGKSFGVFDYGPVPQFDSIQMN